MKEILKKITSLFSKVKDLKNKKQEERKTINIPAEKERPEELEPQKLMAKLSERLEIPIEGENGKWSLVFGDSTIYFQLVNSNFYIMAEVSPAYNKESEYVTLLKANFIGRETGGATLGIDEDTIMLSQIIYSGTEYRQFEAHLANFIKVLEHWQEYMKKTEQ